MPPFEEAVVHGSHSEGLLCCRVWRMRPRGERMYFIHCIFQALHLSLSLYISLSVSTYPPTHDKYVADLIQYLSREWTRAPLLFCPVNLHPILLLLLLWRFLFAACSERNRGTPKRQVAWLLLLSERLQL